MTSRVDRIALLAVPGLAYLAVIYALPLLMLLAKSVQTAEGFSLSEYRAFFADEYNLRVLWRTLRVAARTLGLSYPKAILKVLVPNLAPAYLTSGLFAFLASMDNYPISIFLTDARNKTLPIKMLQYLEEQPDPSLAAMSSGLILLAILVLVFGARTVGLQRMIQG